MLHEPFGYRDAAGVILAVLGAVTVVLSAKQQDREVRVDLFILTRQNIDFDILSVVRPERFTGRDKTNDLHRLQHWRNSSAYRSVNLDTHKTLWKPLGRGGCFDVSNTLDLTPGKD